MHINDIIPKSISLNESIDPETIEKFGKILFGDHIERNFPNREHERDTQYEKHVFHWIRAWFDGWGGAPSRNAIIELSKLKDDYPTLLEPDPVSRFPNLFRTLDTSQHDVDSDEIRDIKQAMAIHYNDPGDPQQLNIKSRDEHTIDHGRKYGNAQIQTGRKPFLYKPMHPVESWTVSLKMAIDISVNQFDEIGAANKTPGRIVIIEAAVPQEERIFKIKFTNTMYLTRQYEIVRVSDKPIEAKIHYLTKFSHTSNEQ